MGDIVEQSGLGWANGGSSMPERWRDDHGSGSFFTNDDRPCLVRLLIVDSNLEMPDEPHPKISLKLVAMPGFDDAGVLHREVDLSLRAHHALKLIHQRPSSVVGVMRSRHEHGYILGLGDLMGFFQWDV